jgi:hypothetical protein
MVRRDLQDLDDVRWPMVVFWSRGGAVAVGMIARVQAVLKKAS